MSTPILLKQRISSGETVYGQFILELFTPGVPQILSNCGFDFLIFDMEHGRCDLTLLAQLNRVPLSAGLIGPDIFEPI